MMAGQVRSAKLETKVYVNEEMQDPLKARKLRYFGLTILLLFCLMAGMVAASMILALKANKGEQTVVHQSIKATEKPSTAYQKSRVECMKEQREHIEVVGDSHRYLDLDKGSRLCHWKQSTKTGKVRLKHHSFIIIHVPGLYRVYGQYAVFHPPTAKSKSSTVSVLLMQNRKEVSMSIVEQCKYLCTRSFSKTVELQKGDKLSLQSGTGGMFKISSKGSYFGINLLQSSDVQQVKV